MVSPACTAGLFCIAAGAVDRCHIHHMWECLLQRVLPAGRSARARERVGRAGSVTRKLYTKVTGRGASNGCTLNAGETWPRHCGQALSMCPISYGAISYASSPGSIPIAQFMDFVNRSPSLRRSGCCWRDQREDLGVGPSVRVTILEAHPLAWLPAEGSSAVSRKADQNSREPQIDTTQRRVYVA